MVSSVGTVETGPPGARFPVVLEEDPYSERAYDAIASLPTTSGPSPFFLVALGVDSNIFLRARVREEAQTLSTQDAMLRGLAVTGGVITSAGIVLAGTFSVLAVLPLVALTQVGITVAFGVLLDTFVVRSVLVPALAFDLGEHMWWPSSLSRRRTRSAVEPVPEPR